ncbi:MAG: dihydroorotase [Clostridia bacterium]|nr:dihydroorotase [Clostridia bacterium]
MKILLSGANVCDGKTVEQKNILIVDGIVSDVSLATAKTEDMTVFDFSDCLILPGFTDVHVHLREPGFSYKETIKSGTKAAAAGGYTAVCSMPNLNPVPSTPDTLKEQLDLIEKDACVHVYPYGSITKDQKGEELSDMDGMKDNVIAFSDDGRGVQSDEMMKSAMLKAKSLNKMIVAHCEVNDLLEDGYIHKGKYAEAHNHKGICSESEWKQIARDIELVKETGCPYHVCHISTKESVEIIRKAKAEGVNITCETGPHYLILDDSCLQEDGRFKMNPPLRDKTDREALIQGVQDGTIDMIATDHAPHSAEEKGKGLEKSAMGVVGLETAFAELYTHLVKTGIITMEKLVQLMHLNPNERFGIQTGLEVGEKANLTVFNLNEKYTVNPETFQSMGRSTPFKGDTVYGKCLLTICDGNIVWQNDNKREEKDLV